VALAKASNSIRKQFIFQFGVDMHNVVKDATSPLSPVLINNLVNKIDSSYTHDKPYVLGNGIGAYAGENGKAVFFNDHGLISSENLKTTNEYKALVAENMVQAKFTDYDTKDHGQYYTDFRDCMIRVLIKATRQFETV
jgi:hypothetical protein